jgi:hypothetical protein
MERAIELSCKQKDILNRAITTWGDRQQVIKAIEEMQELSQALCKWLNLGVQVRAPMIESEVLISIEREMADVFIMTLQLRKIFGDGFLKGHITDKLDRLERYLPKIKFPAHICSAGPQNESELIARGKACPYCGRPAALPVSGNGS